MTVAVGEMEVDVVEVMIDFEVVVERVVAVGGTIAVICVSFGVEIVVDFSNEDEDEDKTRDVEVGRDEDFNIITENNIFDAEVVKGAFDVDAKDLRVLLVLIV